MPAPLSIARWDHRTDSNEMAHELEVSVIVEKENHDTKSESRSVHYTGEFYPSFLYLVATEYTWYVDITVVFSSVLRSMC